MFGFALTSVRIVRRTKKLLIIGVLRNLVNIVRLVEYLLVLVKFLCYATMFVVK